MVDLTALARSMNNMSDVDRALSEFYINRVYSYDSQGRIESMNTVKTDESSAVYYEYPSAGSCRIYNMDTDALRYDQTFTRTGKLLTNWYYYSSGAACYSYQYDTEDRITQYLAAFYNTKQEPTGQTFIYDYSYRTGY